MIPTRATETFSQYFGLMYGLMILAFIIFGKGVYDHYRLWRVGQPEDRRGSCRAGIGRLLRNTFGHSRILKKSYPGMLHWLIFWAFIVLAVGTMSIATHEHTGLPTFQGDYYLVLSLAMNVMGILAMAAIVLFLWRRYVTRPEGLDNTASDWIAPVFILLIMASGFVLSAVRIAISHDPWAAWRPVAYLLSSMFVGMDQSSLMAAHRDIWLIHMCLAMSFIAYVPYSKLFHLLAGPANQLLGKDVAAQSLQPLNLEDESLEQFGVAQIQQFTWKQLLDGDACIRCGRCQDNCPAYLSGKPLSPKKLTQDLKRCLVTMAPKLLAKKNDGENEEALVPGVIGEEEVWACTTCRSCEEQCPMFVEHVPKIVDLRRNLVMMESSFPSEAQVAFRGMENNGNPWNVGWKSRVDWMKGLEVAELAAEPAVEYLYWPGCSGAFDNRNKKVATAMVKLLKKAGVSFAVLGNTEKCCGDSARRLGNEYLYQTLAQENIETLNGHGVKKIITSCPHCFNTLKNEYPQFGGHYEVIHHSVFLRSLIRAGKLTPGNVPETACTYHDSCYLGRYNNVYDEPREIIGSVPGMALKEMKRNKQLGFCCGAGGGRMWLDEPMNARVNFKRTEEALATGANLIATACPFCLTMLEDGIKAKDLNEQIRTRDIAEILWESIQ
jgi:Fe-S oxidoreductase/nitrate reductase gamma subunit